MSLQKAFDDAAQELDLRLVPASQPVRSMGIGYEWREGVLEYTLEEGESLEHNDDRAIKTLLKAYETLSPAEYQQVWRDYAYDPHVAITLDGIGQVDQHTIDTWLRSARLAEFLEEYPLFSPRRVRITQMRIVYIGRNRASATYRTREKYTNGKVLAGNVTAVLAKIENTGWRIVATTKGGREERRNRS